MLFVNPLRPFVMYVAIASVLCGCSPRLELKNPPTPSFALEIKREASLDKSGRFHFSVSIRNISAGPLTVGIRHIYDRVGFEVIGNDKVYWQSDAPAAANRSSSCPAMIDADSDVPLLITRYGRISLAVVIDPFFLRDIKGKFVFVAYFRDEQGHYSWSSTVFAIHEELLDQPLANITIYAQGKP